MDRHLSKLLQLAIAIRQNNFYEQQYTLNRSAALVSNVAKLIVVNATSVCYYYSIVGGACQGAPNDRNNQLYARGKR